MIRCQSQEQVLAVAWGTRDGWLPRGGSFIDVDVGSLFPRGTAHHRGSARPAGRVQGSAGFAALQRSARAAQGRSASWRGRSQALAGAALGVLALGSWDFVEGSSASAEEAGSERTSEAFEHGCRVQAPQEFLERRSFVQGGVVDGKKQAVAIRYLAERYGHVGHKATTLWNRRHALEHAKSVRFMGLPITVHAKIAPALACVEKLLVTTNTGASSYTPRAIGGFRSSNTYRGAEISNHLFGIALDIDPNLNPCCGCVDPWRKNPRCKIPGSAYDRATLPKAWVEAFKRFGFDWLGNDTLEDTMHFEFLGDPDRITK